MSVDDPPDRNNRTLAENNSGFFNCAAIAEIGSIGTGSVDIPAAADIQADVVTDTIAAGPVEAKDVADLDPGAGDGDAGAGLVAG